MIFEKGVKVFEGANSLKEIEKLLWRGKGTYREIPRGFSTIVLFSPDPEIYESPTAGVPMKNIEYFLLIQEKFYKKKVDVLINGTLARETFSPYQFEVVKTIIPKDTSFNKQVSVYTTFEVDMTLVNKKEAGSMNGLSNTGVHTQYATSCFESALKSEFKIQHKYSTLGLNIMTIMLASEVVYDSQTKERCKSISKVKLADFNDITKGFIRVFRQNPEYWQEYVDRINAYAESMKSFSATDKAKKMISSASGASMYRTKADLVEGFADATSRDRMQCELFVVEGKSPASSLISGRRNTLNHAVLPLRGKVLNTSEKSIDDALNNKELFTLLKLIGLGINEHNVVSDCKTLEEAWEKVQKHARYSSIIIATD